MNVAVDIVQVQNIVTGSGAMVIGRTETNRWYQLKYMLSSGECVWSPITHVEEKLA